jgi:UDP-glucose 4-epimerase
MRTVLVTGGAGFIGSHLVDELLASGAAVRVLDNLSTGSLANLQAAAEGHARGAGALVGGRLEVIIGDIRDRGLLRKALRNVKYVFHLAALPPDAASATDVDIHAVNVEGTLNVLHGALTEGVWRVVLGSCASVYGASAEVPVAEESALGPTTLFAASKAAAETYCGAFFARHHLETVNLRYFNVYGPRQKTGRSGALVPQLVEAVRRRRAQIEDDERRAEDFLYVDDAVAATVAAARAPRAAGRIINVGSGELVLLRDVLAILGNLLRVPSVPALQRNLEAIPRRACADSALARQLLEFSPRTALVAGLARVVNSLIDADDVEDRALAPVGFDD